jgi:hypothetical protein
MADEHLQPASRQWTECDLSAGFLPVRLLSNVVFAIEKTQGGDEISIDLSSKGLQATTMIRLLRAATGTSSFWIFFQSVYAVCCAAACVNNTCVDKTPKGGEGNNEQIFLYSCNP